jgi:hypothetical protein
MLIRCLLLVAGLLTALSAFAQFGSGGKMGALKAGLITQSRGNVAAQAAQGKPTSLRKGQPVRPGMVIESEPDSDTVLAFPDGQIGVLGSKGNVRLNNYVYDLVDPSNNDINFSLIEGNLRVVMGEIGKTNSTALKLQVGTASVAMRSSGDAVPADASLVTIGGAIAVAVQAGQLSVRMPDGTVIQVNAGQTLMLSQDGKAELDSTASMMQSLGNSALGQQIRGALAESQGFNQAIAEAQAQMAAVNAVLKNPALAASNPAAQEVLAMLFLESLSATAQIAAAQTQDAAPTTPATGASGGGGGGGGSTSSPASPN